MQTNATIAVSPVSQSSATTPGLPAARPTILEQPNNLMIQDSFEVICRHHGDRTFWVVVDLEAPKQVIFSSEEGYLTWLASDRAMP